MTKEQINTITQELITKVQNKELILLTKYPSCLIADALSAVHNEKWHIYLNIFDKQNTNYFCYNDNNKTPKLVTSVFTFIK